MQWSCTPTGSEFERFTWQRTSLEKDKAASETEVLLCTIKPSPPATFAHLSFSSAVILQHVMLCIHYFKYLSILLNAEPLPLFLSLCLFQGVLILPSQPAYSKKWPLFFDLSSDLKMTQKYFWLAFMHQASTYYPFCLHQDSFSLSDNNEQLS